MPEKFPLKRGDRSTYLILAVGVLVLAAVWIGVLTRLSVEKTEVLQTAQAKANVLADALAQHVDTTIHDIDVIALVVKREYELNPASIDLRALQDEGFFSRATAAQVSVVDATGRILQSTIPYAGGVYITDREHFKVHREPDTRGLYISKPVLGRVSGKWTIQLTRRLEKKNGDFAGVVVVSEDRRYLTREFSNVANLGKSGTASVFLADGTMLSDGASGAETAMANGIAKSTRRDLVEQIVARRPVSGYPLAVEISLGYAEAMVPYTKMKALYLTGTAAFSAFFLMFVTAISVLVHRLSKSRNRLRTFSETDALTGLWNRYGLLARLSEMLPGQVGLNRLAVVYIDLGNLKHVNDTLGHEAGDQLLKKMAARLQDGVTPNILGRFGGDEFIAVLRAEDAAQDIYPITKTVLEKIVDIFEMPVTLRGSIFNIRASIGVAVHARTEDGVATLIREADEAMYAAKSQMRATQKTAWRFYSNEMRENTRRAVEAEQRLRSALSEGILKLAFYPIHRLNEKRAWGFRVAAAITDDRNRLVPVQDAVPVNKENGLLGPLTEFALLQMCATLTGRQGGPVRLAYRLDRNQFLTIDCASIVRTLAREFQVAPGTLVLEVPESAFLEEPLLAENRAAALASTGVKLMLDGFSGGFASFALLEKGLFFGVVISPPPSTADILAPVVERVTHDGLMVVLEEAHEAATGLAHHPLVYAVDVLDAPVVEVDGRLSQ
ncbi:diguanylate cyclase domain-containing protein [Ralstonia pseudosolanacearum]|uniref:diguanylate cyclase domain-containing protein n=1 Tax=Ralstonia pseudosolanacearum TaxID=1310165 RepID=UPI0018A4094B|nr:diguanylate cyclase [Ralstonia pseudosolanacearum]BCL95438.1 GGDEF-domain containing protein [Ralstonia solanacearum]BCM00504.1 GGDEF-domain containing protein [Ralstonia solanacearum]BCM15966.1 GGDEF-domain containing protein [Ralstonia solanacearum]BCN08005.1 GGDEF-domain containing protein [Ralstonia solanacearum]BCN13188.1 GGDEF-domain containing protein [Ralstonia solanacearum]